MEVKTLIEHVRSYYLTKFGEAASDQRNALLEPLLLGDTKDATDLPTRLDLVTVENNEVVGSLSIATEGMVGFEPFTLNWSESLQVHIEPFMWDVAIFVLDGDSLDTDPLIDWYLASIKMEFSSSKDTLLGVPHSMMISPVSDSSVEVEIDLGSLPAEGFFDLIDVFGRCNASQVRMSYD